MKKLIKGFLIIFFAAYFYVGALVNTVKADGYNEAVAAHVIVETVKGNMDISKVMEAEMQRLAYTYAIQMIGIFEKYLPSVLDGMAAEMRAEADKTYKCGLIKDSKNGCK